MNVYSVSWVSVPVFTCMGGSWQPKILSQEGTKRFIHSFLLILWEPSLSMVYVWLCHFHTYISYSSVLPIGLILCCRANSKTAGMLPLLTSLILELSVYGANHFLLTCNLPLPAVPHERQKGQWTQPLAISNGKQAGLSGPQCLPSKVACTETSHKLSTTSFQRLLRPIPRYRWFLLYCSQYLPVNGEKLNGYFGLTTLDILIGMNRYFSQRNLVPA